MTARLIILSLIVAAAVASISCGKPATGQDKPGGGGKGGGGPVPVTAIEVVRKEMPVILRGIGSVRPSATVSVKPRVGGLIASAEFKEGEEVRQGDVLFTIDSKPFEIALARARAAMAQVREQSANAQQQAKRYSSLGSSGGVAKEQLDQFQSTAKASAAGSDAAEAAVKEAEIQLNYCSIKSPISGRTGRRLVDPGNVVVANTTELVVVNQMVPVEVIFSVTEQSLAELTRFMNERTLTVIARPAGDQSVSAEGELSFIDNAVDETTGTLEVKARFANEDRALWPGRFVDVAVTLTTEPDAIVVPAPAVQTGQNGQYVFVVREDRTVEMRPVDMTRTLNNEAVIRAGLAVGEMVVTDGHMQLAPGVKVDLKPPVGTVPDAPREKPVQPVAAKRG